MYPEEDEIPEKFGPKWFEHSRKESKATSPQLQVEETKLIDTKSKQSAREFDMLINDDGEIDEMQLEKFVDEDDEKRKIEA